MRNMLPCQSRCIHPLSDGYSKNRRVTERKKTHFAGGNVSGLAGVIEPAAHRLFYLKLFTSSFLTNLPLSCLQKAGSYVCEVHLHTFRFSLSFSVHQLCVCGGGEGGEGLTSQNNFTLVLAFLFLHGVDFLISLNLMRIRFNNDSFSVAI